MRKKVFLGGTCNGSHWRDSLIPLLEIDYFNPVVDRWDEQAQQCELLEREQDDYCLYVFTPKMEGVYAVAEVVDDSNKRPEKTIMVLLAEDGDTSFSDHQIKALKRVGALVENNGAVWCESLEEAAAILNRGNE
ncbi:nucleoside 2-deoxyribosyltransferase domain-containing protein [Gordonibacter sp.]|uniref:nucleoside 2-deoxyribosyltransferase domain-containing protein n=1 Tax=Gordonibacter sp. TaxID=1968902 RepID=UPI001FA20E8A|nr:nucleoside 2-deoxyribosyltransferase domain-containing protein [Gordonibacter sp.]HIW75920.1 nucleoside 2-deoxyribosyltransferase domain-containing protein [Candidatus Gordonibacter avicola]